MEPYWLQKIAWLSEIVVAVTAVAAARFAYFQITEHTRISHANLMMAIDRRWLLDLREERDLFIKIRGELDALVAQENPHLSDLQKIELIKEKWTKTLQEMRTNSHETYLKLMSICFFLESVGLMTKKKYVNEDDIFGLLSGPIIFVDRFFRPHIEARANEMGVPKGFLEHALYLCDRSRVRDSA